MRKNNINLRILFFMLLSIVMIKTNAQTGLNFQGVARTSNNVILASQAITIKLSILQGSATGTAEYTETRRVTTNAQGLFTAVIGDTGAISTLGNFTTINWKNTPKFLKIEMDAAAGTNFITMGTTQFQYVAYAQFAKSVDAENIVGIVPVILGGTGVNSLTGLKTALTLNNVNNTSDLNKPISTLIQTALDLKANTSDVNTSLGLKLNKADTSTLSNRIDLKANTSDVNTSIGTKVDKVTGKELSTNDYTTVEKTKLAAITGTNTGDQNLSAYATTADVTSGLALKLNKADTSTLSNRIDLKANATDVATDLALKASLSELTSGLANKVDKVSGKNLSTNDYSTTEKTKLAAITGTNTGDQDLSLLATTASVVLKANATDVSTSLALKENISNKSTAVDLGSGATSDILFPTQKAVKTYVDGQINSGGITDGGILTRHLADGAVTGIKLSNSISGYKKFFDGAGNVTISSSVVIDVLIPTGAVATGGISNWQSFTAGMSGKLSLVEFETSNPNSTGPAATVYVEVYSGQGLSGTLLGTSATQTIAGFGNTWKIFDFGLSNIEVLSGNVYTARIVTNSSDQNWLYGGNATYTSGISNVSSTWDHNIKTSVRQYNDDPYLTVGLASNLYGGLVSNATHTGDVSGSTILSITASSNSTLTSLPNLATVGTITSGVWSGTAVAVEKGGTGATTASAARTNLGLVIGTDVQAPLVAGTNYLVPTGSAASLTNFPTFNQSTTGNAATATTAGNITATTNTTLTSLSNLATVGTITSGVWSGTAVAVEKGGTGATTASAARTNLGLVIGTDVQAPLVAGTNYLVPTGSAASLTNFPTFNQSTTGNAATATTAGNITATTNTTLTSLSNLATVGTITSGVWSGTAVAVEKGGTGLISSGTNGQVLTSTGSGTLTWTGTHYIGETYGGGKVFYVYDNGKHGLIAATSDQSTAMRWYGGSNTNTRARGDGVGAGLKNTAIIIANQGAVDGNAFAATVCNEYSVTVDGVTYGDWYLPSKHELDLLYLQKTVVGGFSNSYYWSSTEYGSNFAWGQYFYSGFQIATNKDNTFYVRAIRAF
jgi:hypothetical protein